MNELLIDWDKKTRIELLQYLVDSNQYQTYLEIGCDKNQVFDKISVPIKEGVDPHRGGTVRLTSDNFFKSDKRKWDLIFIDGLHEYDQVKRDVENSLERLTDHGTIVIHDMLPIRESQATSLPTEKYWLGDVWRLGFYLTTLPNIKFNIFNFDFGCGIITKGTQETKNFNKLPNEWNFYLSNLKDLPIVTFEKYFYG